MDACSWRLPAISLCLALMLGGTLLPHIARAENIASVRLGEDLFAAGSAVSIRDRVSGDALLAGGTVDSRSEITGDAAVAGGDVTLGGRIGGDLYAAGGQLTIDAQIGHNARIAGGRVQTSADARIDGGATIGGGTLRLNGTFGRYLNVAGRSVTLGGRVLGDVLVHARELRLEPGTQIEGRLTYHTPGPVTLPADATVRGGMYHVPTAGTARSGELAGNWRGEGLGWVWLMGLFLVGLLIALALPAFAARTSATIAANPWAALGLGFVALICIPATAIVLLITIVGIPLALMLMMLYFVALLAGYVVGALFLAERALLLLGRSTASGMGLQVLVFALVLVALALVAFVPLLGGLVRLAVLLLGLGAIALAVFHTRKKPAETGP